MRTTLTFDDDVTAMLAKARKARKASFKAVVNEALRQGLYLMVSPPPRKKPFRTRAWNLGPSLIGNLDNIEEVLAAAEGEWHK